ncbi:MAG: peroxiredoxin-like family protein [Allomuricauda sp.]
METINLNLKEQLEEKKSLFEKNASTHIKKIYREGIDSVRASGVTKNAKQVGDLAPDFILQNATGKNVRLSDYLNKGPVVLIWYRGGWCPYCNITLAKYQQELGKIKEAGASLLAITPELPDNSLSTKEKNSLEFEVLSDPHNEVAKTYGVVFKLTPDVAENYQDNFDLESYNGDSSYELPLGATYVIDSERIIKYAFLDADYRNRAEPKEVINNL